MKDNIIKFKNKTKITEGEINGLFLGLVKLIKKLAIEEANETMPKDIRILREELQQANLILSKKESDLERLREENQQLKSKLKVKNLKILQLSCLSAKRLSEYKT